MLKPKPAITIHVADKIPRNGNLDANREQEPITSSYNSPKVKLSVHQVLATAGQLEHLPRTLGSSRSTYITSQDEPKGYVIIHISLKVS
eukprot:snap_masked-scaffold_43-processed-gene-1.88-mRNA-1 protein AED:1.00 eAED:1.00 QI:0/0/0/0/1/1/2/0/88